MGLWTDRVLPHVIDRALDTPDLRALRARVCVGLQGRVLEVGFGSGLNLVHYPAEATAVLAVEPSDSAWRLAQPRIRQRGLPVERAGLDGQRLAVADGSVDAVLSTFTLCTIPDPAAALGELRRVLVPGGQLHFLEHGRAPDEGVRRWQRRLNPLQARVAGGCHLDRPIDDLVVAAGFEIVTLDCAYAASPKPFGYVFRGIARR